MKNIFLRLLAVCLLSLSTATSWAQSCTFVTTGTPASGNLVVPSTAAGVTILTGTVQVALDCMQTTPNGLHFSLPFGTNVSPLLGISGVGITLNGAPSATGNAGLGATNGGPGCPGITYPDSTWSKPNSYDFFGNYGTGNCKMLISIPFKLVTLGGSASGTTGLRLTNEANPLLQSFQPAGWGTVSMGSSYWANAVDNVPSWTFVPASCTLALSNIAVALPTVPASALSVPGSTAGATRFNIGLTTCNNPGASNVNVLASWSFSQGTANNIIRTGVTNLGVQIMCAPAGSQPTTPIVNGQSTTIYTIPASSSGVNSSAACAAQYIADGAAASTGSFVNVPVNFTLTYN